MKTQNFIITLLCLLSGLYSCRKPYAPSLITTDKAYLVVEGVINSGSDSTIIKLSHTVILSSTTKSPERRAQVTVESDKNDVYKLTEESNGLGYYRALNLNLPTDRKYRLHIITSNGKEYVSDYVENKITPPIDSVYSLALSSGVQFSISTHDNSNKTRYYRWDYNESWRYNVGGEHPSLILYKNGNIISRNPDSLVSDCYKFGVPGNNIYLANSTTLSKDVISQYPLGYVDATTRKLRDAYSFQARQYALTDDAYKYWQLLKKNTEQLGSILDAQPSSAISNIHSASDPKEIVVGYVSVSTITTKRVFLDGRKLPFRVLYPPIDSVSCGGGTILIAPENTFPSRLNNTFARGDSLLIEDVYDKMGNLIGYTYSNAICVDCRLLGGTNKKPSYWPADL